MNVRLVPQAGRLKEHADEIRARTQPEPFTIRSEHEAIAYARLSLASDSILSDYYVMGADNAFGAHTMPDERTDAWYRHYDAAMKRVMKGIAQ